MLTADQIKLVQVAARAVGLRLKGFDGRYRMLLSQYIKSDGSAVTSCKDLNKYQFEDFLAICESLGFRSPGKSDTYYRDIVSQSGELASYAQQKAIEHLRGDCGWSVDNLNQFILKMTGKALTVSTISTAQAAKIIEAFKAILGRTGGRNFKSLKEVQETFN